MNQIKERIFKEAEDDVSLRARHDTKGGETVQIAGRGDLHLGILLEKMRREGFEMQITPPKVVTKEDAVTGKVLEPIEHVEIECDAAYSAMLIERMHSRQGELIDTWDTSDGLQVLEFHVPSRGMLGFRTEVVTETRGTAVMKTHFLEYSEMKGKVNKNQRGALINTASGTTQAYSLRDIEKKGNLFVGAGESSYTGQVIGEHVLNEDMEMNACKAKALTNMRTSGSEEAIKLQGHKQFTIEEAVSYIRDDELVEVTPRSIRLRKKILDPQIRQKMRRDEKNAKKNATK